MDVPLRWMTNNKTRITMVSGTTNRPIWGAYSLMPSIALKTEIAGVMTPSAVEQGCPDEADHDHHGTPPALLGAARTDQCKQCQYAALAVIVGAQ